jgi:WD40 repeat protein
VRIWDVASQQLLDTLEGHVGYVYWAEWAPDDLLVSSSEDVTIRLWSPSAGEFPSLHPTAKAPLLNLTAGP